MKYMNIHFTIKVKIEMTSTNVNERLQLKRSRENTPEHQVIPSQHHLQQILEMDDPFTHVPPHIIADYQSRGLILVSEEGKLYLATPIKSVKDD
jgi:hypothetical protein